MPTSNHPVRARPILTFVAARVKTTKAVTIAVSCALATCGGDRPQTDQGDVETIRSEIVTHSALPSSFGIIKTAFYENTARVVPPSNKPTTNCPNGGIAIQTGQLPGNPVLSFPFRSLVDANGNIDTATPVANDPAPLPNPTNSTPFTDNQMVRLSDGSLLAIRTVLTWDAVVPALSFAATNVFFNAFSTKAGGRGSYFLFRSVDCGATWSLWSKALDLAVFAGGKWGYPRPVSIDSGGNIKLVDASMPPHDGKTWYIGGGDREELYACPFTKNVYFTSHLGGGKYYVDPKAPASAESIVLLMSKDSGLTWSIVQENLPEFVPVVMTSTPNGRLFLFGISPSGQPLVQFSQPMGLGGTPVLSQSFDASFVENGQKVPAARSNAPRGFMILSDQNTALGLNAYNGASEGGALKFTNQCTISNSDCTWSYQNGMIVSATPGSPPFALNAKNGARENGTLQLTTACATNNPDCTWTYKGGRFLSDRNKSLAIKVLSNGDLTLTSTCAGGDTACTFTMPHVMLSSATNAALRVNAFGGAANGVALKLSGQCTAANPDCTWTFKRGMITSDTSSALAINAAGGAAQGTVVKLSNACTQSNPDCTWTWTGGELISDNSWSPFLPINAFGGAKDGASLLLNSACTASNPDCVFNGLLLPPADAPTLAFTPSLSRISTDSSTSKVRLVYSSVNANNTQDARVVNFNATDAGHPVSVTTLKGSTPGTHSVMFTTFVDPDYMEMPSFFKSNTSILYWEDVPSKGASDHTYSTQYVMISGDSDVGPIRPLSVSSGAVQPWTERADIGDYVNGGFFWMGKTLNYLAQWIEPTGLKANVVTANSTAGFMIKSDTNSNLAVNATNGAADGTILTLSSACTIGNPDCTWSYQRGMIVSDSDPTLAINAFGGAADGTVLKLSRACTTANPDCTWTYRQGGFFSDRNQTLAIRAAGAQAGTTLKLASDCGTTLTDCTWTLPHVMIMVDRDSKLAVAAPASNGAAVSQSNTCSPTIPQCTWTFSKGMITSDANVNPPLRMNASGGAANGTAIKLSNACSATNSDCTWTWIKGELLSGNFVSSTLAINAFGGARVNGPLQLNTACAANNPDCRFSGMFGN